MPKYKECVKCKTPKNSKWYGIIFLTNDGYCSVCNAKYKDRVRITPFFKFKLKKDIEYPHLSKYRSKKLSKREKEYIEFRKNHHGPLTLVNYQFNQFREKQNKKIDQYL